MLAHIAGRWAIHLRIRGPVDLFLRPWEVDISRRTSLDSPLPVQVLEASPKGHYTQLVVQPLGVVQRSADGRDARRRRPATWRAFIRWSATCAAV